MPIKTGTLKPRPTSKSRVRTAAWLYPPLTIVSLGLLGTATSKEALAAPTAQASDSQLAQAVRPHLNFHKSHRCWPLTFQEIAATASASDRDGMKNRCNKSYNPNFVVFASVKRPSDESAGSLDAASFRVTYGVAFGWQNGTFSGLTKDFIQLFDEAGEHGEDAQYLTVDVVNGALTSVWADLHKGYYARTRSQLTLYNGEHVVAWAGPFYNSLKLLSDTTTVCSVWGSVPKTLQTACYAACQTAKSCGDLDTLMNFGDRAGSAQQGDGKLVMVEDVCNTPSDQEYRSPDNISYGGKQLEALKGYIGCSGSETPGAWTGYFKKKAQYTNPYGLKGCKRGDTNGGNICNATVFGEDDLWTTFAGKQMSIDPSAVGNADVDYGTGAPFNDLLTSTAAPREITIRGGERIDAVSVTYVDGTRKTHGGGGGGAQTLGGLDKDPVVTVTLCEGTKDGKTRAGKIVLRTLAGRTLSAGKGSGNCRTINPAGRKLYGFYGRSGDEMDLLGTYWGTR